MKHSLSKIIRRSFKNVINPFECLVNNFLFTMFNTGPDGETFMFERIVHRLANLALVMCDNRVDIMYCCHMTRIQRRDQINPHEMKYDSPPKKIKFKV